MEQVEAEALRLAISAADIQEHVAIGSRQMLLTLAQLPRSGNWMPHPARLPLPGSSRRLPITPTS
jgi:hypothetical protein